MNTIPAQELKRRGITAVDEALQKGAVHVIKNNEPRYVVLSEEHYARLVEAEEEAYLERMKLSLNDMAEGRTRRHKNVDSFLAELGLAD